jgi:hypothetical protein
MLFRFIIPSGIADFWADGNSRLTVEAFFFNFKCLNGSPDCLSMLPRLAPYGVALPDELVHYRDPAAGLRDLPIVSAKFGRNVTGHPPRDAQ